MRIFLTLLFLNISLVGFSQEASQNDYVFNTKTSKTFKSSTTTKSDKKKESTFKAGEWLKFRMHYGALNASYATLHVKNDKIHAENFQERHLLRNKKNNATTTRGEGVNGGWGVMGGE